MSWGGHLSPLPQHRASLVLMMQLNSGLDPLSPLLAPGSGGGVHNLDLREEGITHPCDSEFAGKSEPILGLLLK